ncbi:MAG TPA: hypothetical protein VHD35_00550 [Chitinophagaceae bacterium]|nr:hypothetical protein [Chitinophagaceae bacterium]
MKIAVGMKRLLSHLIKPKEELFSSVFLRFYSCVTGIKAFPSLILSYLRAFVQCIFLLNVPYTFRTDYFLDRKLLTVEAANHNQY